MSALVSECTRHILVTGGAGYIGSHTVLALLVAGFHVTVVDNLSNSSEESLRRVRRLAGGPDAHARLHFHKIDLLDARMLEDDVFRQQKFDACIHFAGLKVTHEHTQAPPIHTHGRRR